jgi:probable F420-dependent oxidoreductase
METTDELRRVLGPVGIWMPPPTGTGLDPAGYGREIEAAGFGSVWFPRMNSVADLKSVEPTLAATDHLVLGTGIASIWTWAPAELASETNRLAAAYPGRFILGLGVSHAPPIEATGQAYAKPYSKMVAFLDELGEVAAPVMLAALGPKMLELSRDATLGAHPYFVPPEHTAYARQVLGAQPLLIPELAAALAPREQGAAAARAYVRQALPGAAELHDQPTQVRLHRRGSRGCGQRSADVAGRAERERGDRGQAQRALGGGGRPRGGATAHRRRDVRRGWPADPRGSRRGPEKCRPER